MSYQITLSNGNILTSVPDTQLVSTYAGLDFIGKNYPGYGTVLNNNLAHMIENFADSVPPTNPLVGQIWYDTIGNTINFWNGAEFKSISVIYSNDTAPTNPQLGDEWYNTIDQQLFIWNSYEWVLIGPPGNEGGGKEGFVIAQTSTGIYYVELYANNQLLGIISSVSLPNPGITGFGNIRPGLNFVSDPDSSSGLVSGGIYNISQLTIGDADQIYLSTDAAGHNTSNLVLNGNTIAIGTSDGYGSSAADVVYAKSQFTDGNIGGALFVNCLVANSYVGLPTVTFPTIPGSANGQVLFSNGAAGFGGASSNLVVYDSNATVFVTNLFVTATSSFTGNISATSNLNITGNIVSSGNISGNFAQLNSANINNHLNVIQNANIYGSLKVAGDSTIQGNISLNGNLNLGGSTQINGTVNATGDIHTSEDLQVDGSGIVSQTLSVGGALNVTGKATFNYGASAFSLPSTYGSVLGGALITNLDGTTSWSTSNISAFSNNSIGASGYQYLPSGLIIQWGTTAVSLPPSGSTTQPFPITFPNACFAVILGQTRLAGQNSSLAQVDSYNDSGFTWDVASSGSINGTTQPTYFAIGH